MSTRDFGWLWWVNTGSSIVTNVPLDVDNEAGYAYRKYTGNLCTLPSVLLWLPWWLSGKESACQCGKCRFDPWVLKIPWRRKWQPTPVFLPGIFHGQRNYGLQSMGLQRGWHDWVTKYTHAYLLEEWPICFQKWLHHFILLLLLLLLLLSCVSRVQLCVTP